MLYYLLLCNVLFLPFIYSSDRTISKPDIANKTQSESPKGNLSNETKVTLLSEGGSLLPETSILALAKEKLSNLDNELGKNKVKPVVARKGVVYIEDDDVKSQPPKPSESHENSTIAHKLPDIADANEHLTNSTKKVMISNTNFSSLNKTSGGDNGVNVTEKHKKKPLILSYDTLADTTVKSSTETFITSQRPNKVYAKSSNSHPGMIMPLVITILLVPMFAVLGYMALRRGQEAWKNRHYKRMDFLLDGMYND